MVDDAPRILGGRYEVGELIGRGGMAEVHIGHDTRLGRTVAIKILRSDLARDPSFQARFRREAQAAASLNHPAIVAVYDTGEDIFTEPGGAVSHVPFIVMEYVEGHTVRDILRDGTAVPIEEAVEITAGVLSALEYSHHAGIVHRDIKPANVMLTPTGAVKVMDFGIARAMADSAGTMTQTQAVIGTAQYLSPEQARGEQVDSRSDLYSTGCLLFELLTGRPPFIGDSPVAVAYQHAREQAPPPSTFASDIPEALDRITSKALAKDRDQRYSSAAEFRADLESALRGGHVNAPAVGALAAGALAGAAATEVLRPGPQTAATQVMGAGAGATQALPPTGAAPWSQVGGAGTGTTTRTTQGTDPDEDEAPRRRWILWVLIGVALAAVIGIAIVLTQGGGEEEPVLVTVPNVVGMDEAQARAAITDLGLEFERVSEPSLEVQAGFVISTDPGADEQVDEGATVQVVVSEGAEEVEIPDMSNYTQQQARAELERLGFTDISVSTEDSPDVDKDRVIRTDPAAGTAVDPTATPVTLVLSTGLVQLPNLLDPPRTLEQARGELVALGLIPSISEEATGDAPPGTVIAQSRTPGPVPQGSEVGITVATAPVIEKVSVPDVTGKRYDEAAAQLGAAGLNSVAGEAVFDATQPEGRVVRTEPAAGTSVDEGSTVTVILSKGKEPAPDDDA
ncbi:Stk1 family PASTA domain-containing Ser/Thr kinase [Actinotalea sp. JY-7885]|uniref:Stk1 family PASTA domain-containing Ser/Thr kinase n=1 Tax=Actinotalea sp. JY-7885 TaxID=2758576 RepID=UPI00165D4F5E